MAITWVSRKWRNMMNFTDLVDLAGKLGIFSGIISWHSSKFSFFWNIANFFPENQIIKKSKKGEEELFFKFFNDTSFGWRLVRFRIITFLFNLNIRESSQRDASYHNYPTNSKLISLMYVLWELIWKISLRFLTSVIRISIHHAKF